MDAVVELVVFAPLGLALTARDNLPELIAKGRAQVSSQVTLARMVGQFAVNQGEKDLRKRLEGVAETLSALGILPEATPAAPVASTPAPTTPAPAPATAEAEAAATASVASGTAGAGAPADGGDGEAGPTPSSAALAIPGYDNLSASQVVQRLAGLGPEELEAVRAYEAATRGRRTILSKVAQLASGTAG